MTMEFKRKEAAHTLRIDEERLKDGSIVPLLRYPLLEETGIVQHCFTTRAGGVSEGCFSSLNFTFSRGDDPQKVQKNYERAAEALGISTSQIVCSDQTHTTTVRRVTKEDAGSGLLTPKRFSDVDGMITNEPGLMLMTGYADCVPLYFVDPQHHAIGLSHSGWRGTVGRMGARTVEAMQKEFDSRPENLICAIGPSICQDCYEVSEDVAMAFAKEFPKEKEAILYEKGGGKYQLNLWKANEIILIQAGILPQHLAVTDICTCCNKELLFSHRGSHGQRGNLGAFLMLNE
ncbi:MAG: peptidoglycan editing factor PgeF [Lachnospiraceae bacterium]